MQLLRRRNINSNPVAVYYVHQFSKDQTLKLACEVRDDLEYSGDICYFSSWGNLLAPTATYAPCAHYLTPLNPRIKCAIVLERAIPLPASRSLSVVLGTMLRKMGEGSVVWIQANQMRGKRALWVTPNDLKLDLPSIRIECPNNKPGWIRLDWGRNVARDLTALQSIYPVIVEHLADFYRVLASAGHPCANVHTDPRHSVEYAFSYSMHWALHSLAIFEMQLPAPTCEVSGIDIGGSYGFLTCELAARGFRMTNFEVVDWHITEIFPWLAKCCGVESHVNGIIGKMENLSSFGKLENYDFILFMGSLLYIDRKDVPDAIESAWKLIKPGGILGLRENVVPENERHKVVSSDRRFTSQELHDFVNNHGGVIEYFCHNGVKREFSETANLWTIFVTAKKSSMSIN